MAAADVASKVVVVAAAATPAPPPLLPLHQLPTAASRTNVHSFYNPNQLPPCDVLNELNPNFAGHSLAQDKGNDGGEVPQQGVQTNEFVFDTPQKGRECDAETIASLPTAERE